MTKATLIEQHYKAKLLDAASFLEFIAKGLSPECLKSDCLTKARELRDAIIEDEPC